MEDMITEKDDSKDDAMVPVDESPPEDVDFNPMADFDSLMALSKATAALAYTYRSHCRRADPEGRLEEQIEWVNVVRGVSGQIRAAGESILMVADEIDDAVATADRRLVRACLVLNNGFAGEA